MLKNNKIVHSFNHFTYSFKIIRLIRRVFLGKYVCINEVGALSN